MSEERATIQLGRESDATEFFLRPSIWVSARAGGLTLCVQGSQTFIHERMPKQALFATGLVYLLSGQPRKGLPLDW